MMNEHEATSLPSVLENAANKIPEKWRHRAALAVMRLIGASVGSPYMAKARENLDTMDGKSFVSKELAKEVASRAKSDPEIMDRAMERFLGEEFRKQQNREQIALLTFAEADHENGDSPQSPPEQDIDPDWMSKFSRHAEDVSSEKMQRLWARVLAGEIKQPGSFSTRTLRFMAELDQNVATTFEEVCAHTLAGNAIFAPTGRWNSGLPYKKILLLLEAGLVSDGPGQANRPISGEGEGNHFVWGTNYGLVMKCSTNLNFEIPVILFTSVGKEVFKLLKPNDEVSVLTDIANYFRHKLNPNPTRAYVGPRVPLPQDRVTVIAATILWDTTTSAQQT